VVANRCTIVQMMVHGSQPVPAEEESYKGRILWLVNLNL